jgi:lysophospholipase L1-like esterase
VRALALPILLLALTASAQERAPRTLPIEQPIEDPSGHALDGWATALAGIPGGRRALVSVWGGSHTASDQYTGVLRRVLARRHGDGGPGQFFPARPMLFYDRLDVTIDDTSAFRGLSTRGHRVADDYGRAGILLEASRRATATATLAGPRARAGHLELWAIRAPGGGTVTIEAGGVSASISTAASATSPAGTQVRASLDPAAGARAITVRALGDGPVRVAGVVAESSEAGVVVESFGVSGARARDVLLWREASFHEQLAARPPDLFVLAYGTNESAESRTAALLEADLHALVQRFRAAAPAASCLIVGPSDRPRFGAAGWVARPGSTRVRDAYRRAAIADGCAFFDLLAWEGGPGSVTEWVERGWALGDHVHFTDEGYRRLGESLAARLDP